MNIKKHPGLILILTALMVTVCRCSFAPGNPATMNFTNGKSSQCTQFVEYFGYSIFGANSYDCLIPCLDGSTVKVTFEDAATDKEIVGKGKFDLAALQKQYCKAPPLEAPRTATPIPPLIIPKSISPLTSPLLTEEITSCSLRAHYINMRKTQSPPDLTDRTLTISINKGKVDCTIPSDNQSVYSCILPKKVDFPANITVTLDDIEINNFNVTSNLCSADNPINKPNDSGSPISQPPQQDPQPPQDPPQPPQDPHNVP